MAESVREQKPVYSRRRGVLLPLFSLPSEYGIGTLGAAAHRFVDLLKECGANMWAILPTGVTGYGDSPYQSFSSFALNPYFLDLDMLVESGLLTKEECGSVDFGSDAARVDYGKLYENRLPLLLTAYARAKQLPGHEEALAEFEKTAPWLDDHARFMAIKEAMGGAPWYEWPDGLKNRKPAAMAEISEKIACEVGFHKFLQMELARQWKLLSEHAREKGIMIMGDLPIYCAYDSADCWAYRDNFRFDKNGRPTEVAGVPPDYFCEDGQLWGNPVYNWTRMKKDGFKFWMARLRRCAELYDILRIDHFRGFASYYAVPAGAENARNGVWRKAEGKRLFDLAAQEELPVEIVAEDLGFITRDVRALLKRTGFAGMQVMEFAFDSDRSNPHKNRMWNGDPAALRNKIAYTGTHDNPPLAAWWEETDEKTRRIARRYARTKDLPYGIVKAVANCDARFIVIPVQDVLLMGAEARINTPATASGNWSWRATADDIKELAEKLKTLFD
ncbi:MAG: 4-alpha-glucanotransferase [Clostridia bacterium]|nr:4-alpha-glucanotransferase [Clostridia bacterium]